MRSRVTALIRRATSRARQNTAPPPNTTTGPADDDAELSAAHAEWLAEEAAFDHRMWVREGKVAVACSGCGSEFYVPLPNAAGPAWCGTFPGCREPLLTPLPDVADTTLTVAEHTPRWHSPKHDHIHPGRRVILIPGHTWLFLPETCTVTDSAWFTHTGQPALRPEDRVVLLCFGCGLDST